MLQQRMVVLLPLLLGASNALAARIVADQGFPAANSYRRHGMPSPGSQTPVHRMHDQERSESMNALIHILAKSGLLTKDLDYHLIRSPPSLLTTAACGGLRSAPDCRPRRTYLC
jgi:hypothetical protein